jgi:hypothetical protein
LHDQPDGVAKIVGVRNPPWPAAAGIVDVMTTPGSNVEMVSIPRADLDAMKAELRRLRRAVGRDVARSRIQADPGPGDEAPVFTREQLAETWGIRG